MKTALPVLLLMPAAALAASGFDGTWKLRLDSVRMTGKPSVYNLVNGEYTCVSCVPQLKVKADGAEHKVTGHPYYDAVAMTVVDANTIQSVFKHDGKETVRSTETVSADGGTLTAKFIEHTGAKESTGEYTAKRVAPAPAGAHAISGSWQMDHVASANDVMRTMEFAMTSEHFTMHWNGQSYHANFDGKEVPIVGDPGHTQVSLKRVDEHTVQETDYRQGKVMDEIRMSVSADGKSIDVEDRDVPHGQTTTYTLDKQ